MPAQIIVATKNKSKRRSLPLYEGPEEVRLRMWVQLLRTCSLMQKKLSSVLFKTGLTLSQFDVLATLDWESGVTQQELAERLLVTKGNVCGLIDRLGELGWVKRLSDPQDARARRLTLTTKGREKIQAAFPEHAKEVMKLTQGLSDDDSATLRGLLWQLERSVEDGSEHD